MQIGNALKGPLGAQQHIQLHKSAGEHGDKLNGDRLGRGFPWSQELKSKRKTSLSLFVPNTVKSRSSSPKLECYEVIWSFLKFMTCSRFCLRSPQKTMGDLHRSNSGSTPGKSSQNPLVLRSVPVSLHSQWAPRAFSVPVYQMGVTSVFPTASINTVAHTQWLLSWAPAPFQVVISSRSLLWYE